MVDVFSSTAVVLGSASFVVKAGSVDDVFSSIAVVLGSVSFVVKAGSVAEVFSSTTMVLGSASAVGEVKIGSQVGIGRSLVVIKGISLSSMSPLPLFERTLTITATTATHTITIAVIATIATVLLAVSFMKDVIVVVVVVVVEGVEVVASFMEEVVVFVVVVITAVVEVDVHADDDIDPEESVNILSCFALEFTQETPQSICSKDVALLNIPYMLVTAETSQADRSWLKDCAL